MRRSRLIYTRDFLLPGPLTTSCFIAPRILILFYFAINNDNSVLPFLWGVTPGKSIKNPDFPVHTCCIEDAQNEKRSFVVHFLNLTVDWTDWQQFIHHRQFFLWLLINAKHQFSKTCVRTLLEHRSVDEAICHGKREPETKTSLLIQSNRKQNRWFERQLAARRNLIIPHPSWYCNVS